MKALLVALAIFCLSPEMAMAQEQPSPVSFNFSAFSNYQLLGEGSDLGWTRAYPVLKAGKLAFDFELEFASLDDRKGGKRVPLEWFSQGRLIYRPNAATAVMVGRNFRPFGYSTFAPVLLKTAKYPDGYPFGGYYAYGVRLDRKVGAWDTKFDLTATPGSFRKLNFTKPEFTLGASRKRGVVNYGFAGQFSRKFARGGINFTVDAGAATIAGGIFGASDKKSPISGLLFAETKAVHGIAPHAQYFHDPERRNVWTFGLTFVKRAGNIELKLITDAEQGKPVFRTQIQLFPR